MATDRLTWSETAARLHELPLAATFAELVARIADQDREAALAELLRAAQGGQATAVYRLAGAPRWIRLTAVAVGPERVAGTAADVSDVKRIETALENRRELLSMVSHDLRNPLGVVMMQLTLLEQKRRRGVLGEAEISAAIDRLTRAGKQMERLVNDLLDLGRIDTGRLALSLGEHLLRSITDDALETARPMAYERRIALSLDFAAPESTTIRCDRGRILQALSNLLGNALKFSPEGTRVTLRAALEGGQVRFSVEDQGPGIGSGELEHIFERRWQGHGGRRGGLGLGLPIAKFIAEAHGGKIGVHSRVGEGSCFHICVPACPAVEPAGAQVS